jgi:hypothetical protein
MAKNPIDLERIRKARERLDRIAEEYPELVDRDNPPSAEDWERTLRDSGITDNEDNDHGNST